MPGSDDALERSTPMAFAWGEGGEGGLMGRPAEGKKKAKQNLSMEEIPPWQSYWRGQQTTERDAEHCVVGW